MANQHRAEWTPDDVREAKNSLIKYYSDQQGSQSTRLVGFAVGLFTLLGLAQVSFDKGLREVYSNFQGFVVFTDIPWFWDFCKVVFLLFSTWLILFFIVRSIFRYAMFGYMSTILMNLPRDVAEQIIVENAKKEEVPVFIDRQQWAFNVATMRALYKDVHLFWIFRARWFFTSGDIACPSCENKGHLLSGAVAFAFAVLLLLFLW